jgi:prenyl protein peptidase
VTKSDEKFENFPRVFNCLLAFSENEMTRYLLRAAALEAFLNSPWLASFSIVSQYLFFLFYFGALKTNETRNDARVIKIRFAMQTLACAVGFASSALWSLLLLHNERGGTGEWRKAIETAFALIATAEREFTDEEGNGLFLALLRNVSFGCLVTILVYLGPIADATRRSQGIVGAFQSLFGHHSVNAERYGWLVPARDVVLAPFFEEFIFRGAVLAVLLGGGGVGVQRAVLLSPLFFGLAHVNHYFELKKIYGRRRALCAVLFQFSYTTAFGVLAGVVFWRCKAGLVGAWSLHASANAFGAPDFRPFRTSGGLFTSNVLEKMCYVLGLVSAFAFVRSSIVAYEQETQVNVH